MATIDLGKIKQVFRGTYNNATAYAVDDLVVFTDGSVTSTYICTTASTGNNPSSSGTAHANWAYVAKGQATSPTTTQGDVIVRGASADARLAIGTAGQVLKVNSSANGLEYGVGGRILQVVQASKGDIQSWSGTTKTELTGLAPTITPSSSSNKILVMGQLYSSSDGASRTAYNVVERSINGGSFGIIGNHATASDSSATNSHGHGGTFAGTWNLMNSSMIFLDSPNTTNAIVYKWFFQNEGGTTYINRTGRHSTVYHPKTISTLTLMEVAV